MSYEKLCAVCEKVAGKKCSPCLAGVLYCGVEHQQLHWKVHKSHHGKNNGLFAYPPLTKNDGEMFFWLCFRSLEMLIDEARPGKATVLIVESFKQTLAARFTETISAIILTIDPEVNTDLVSLETAINTLVHQFTTGIQKLSAAERMNNGIAARLQILNMVARTKRLSTATFTFNSIYGLMPPLDLKVVDKSDDWILATSTYYFQILNFEFAGISHSVEESVHTLVARRNLWSRVLEEVENMKVEGTYKFIKKGHEALAGNLDYFFEP